MCACASLVGRSVPDPPRRAENGATSIRMGSCRGLAICIRVGFTARLPRPFRVSLNDVYRPITMARRPMNISPVPDGPVLPLNLRIADDAQETDRRRINHHGSMLDGSVKEKTVAGAQVINLVVMPIIHFSFQHEEQFVTWMAKYVLARIDLSLLDVHEVRLKIFLKRQAKGQGLIVVPHLRAPADDDLSFVFADEYRPTLRTIDLEEVARAHPQCGRNAGQRRNG